MNRRKFLVGTGAALAAGVAVPGLVRPGALAAEEDGDLSAQATTNLEFWNPANDPTGSKIIGGLVNSFNKTIGKNKGIHVANITKAVGTAGYVQYTTAMSSTGSPDVVMTYAYNPVAGWAGNGFLKPLDSYAKHLGIDQSQFFPSAWRMVNFGGHTWGLLQEFDMNMLAYNTTIHKGAPPQTIDELNALHKEYTTFDSNGHLTQVGIVPWNQGTLADATDWCPMFGGSFYDQENLKWTIDKSDNLPFLEWVQNVASVMHGRAEADLLVSGVNPNINGQDIFTLGKAVFELEGEYVQQVWKVQDFSISSQYGIAPDPTANGVPHGAGVVAGGNVFVLPSKSPHPEEAAQFIQYMGGATAVRGWCLPNANLPPVKSYGESTGFQNSWPFMSTFIDTLKSKPVTPATPSPQFALFETIMGTAIDSVSYGKSTPKEALSSVSSRIAQEVARFKQQNPKWQGE